MKDNDIYYDPDIEETWIKSPYWAYISKFSFENEPEFTSKEDAKSYLTELGTWALASHKIGHGNKRDLENTKDLAIEFANDFVDENELPKSSSLTVRYNYLNDFLTYMFNIEDNSYNY